MDPRDLILSRTFACTPEAAFRCWTEPDLLRRFFAPRPGLTTQAEIDLRPGGRFYTVMQFEEWGEIATEGCVLLVEPGGGWCSPMRSKRGSGRGRGRSSAPICDSSPRPGAAPTG